MLKINSGRGTLGRFIHDTAIAQNLKRIVTNLEKTSEGMDETMKETKENILALMERLQGTAGNTETFSKQLGETMIQIKSGNGTIGRLIQDTIIAENLNLTMINLQRSSKGLDENMEALKHNFLLRGYFKRKAIAAEKIKQDSIENKSRTKRY